MFLHIFRQITVIRGERKQVLSVIAADPEHKAAVGHVGAVDEQPVGEHRGDQHNVAVAEGIETVADLHTHIALQKKVKFVVGMRVHIHRGQIVIVVIIKLKVLRQHILPRTEGRLQFFLHIYRDSCLGSAGAFFARR